MRSKAIDAGVAELPAIEADRIRAETGRQRDLVEQLLVEAPDLHEQLAGRRLPVQRHVAVDLLQALHLVGDGSEAFSVAGLSVAACPARPPTRRQTRDTNARTRRRTIIGIRLYGSYR